MNWSGEHRVKINFIGIHVTELFAAQMDGRLAF